MAGLEAGAAEDGAGAGAELEAGGGAAAAVVAGAGAFDTGGVVVVAPLQPERKDNDAKTRTKQILTTNDNNLGAFMTLLLIILFNFIIKNILIIMEH